MVELAGVERERERWASRIGLILAMAGNAVGLGNFLRFPVQAASNGGGAFMIPYFLAFLLLGIPLMWIEWGIGRFGGRHGHGSLPGMYDKMWRVPIAKYIGALGVFMPLAIVIYYTYIESWTLAYSFFSLTKQYFGAESFAAAREFLGDFISLKMRIAGWLPYAILFYVVTLFINVAVLARGIAGGIERLAKVAMPTLFILAIILAIRVLILGAPDPRFPHRNAMAGLAYIWVPHLPKHHVVTVHPEEAFDPNSFRITTCAETQVPFCARLPYDGWDDRERAALQTKVRIRVGRLQNSEAIAVQLVLFPTDVFRGEHVRAWVDYQNRQNQNPDTHWTTVIAPTLGMILLAAAGQIFFTLSVGTGAIQTYASYLSDEDDIVLTGLATASTNEFAEVVLGGTIAIPASVAFFGLVATQEIAAGGAFNLGFVAMPLIFQKLPAGALFGAMWFLLLFFAGITSSVALSQPTMAFLQDELRVPRLHSALITGTLILVFSIPCVLWSDWLDEMDFWAGTFGLVLFALIETIIFCWIYGVRNAWEELHKGADIRVPGFFRPVIQFVTPAILLAILAYWGWNDALPKIRAGNVYQWGARIAMLVLLTGWMVAIGIAWQRRREEK